MRYYCNPILTIVTIVMLNAQEHNATIEWRSGFGSDIGSGNNIVVADVDDDGENEIIFGNSAGFLHILGYVNGEYIEEWRSPFLRGRLDDTPIYGLDVGDLDGDGTIEIICAAEKFHIFSYDGNTYIEEWSSEPLGSVVFGIETYDIDNDGMDEIFYSKYGLCVLEFDGADYITTYSDYGYFTVQSDIGVGDVDNDGDLEIIVKDYYNSVKIYGFNGQDYYLETSVFTPSAGTAMTLGDVDSDGTLEILFTGNNGLYIFGYADTTYSLEWYVDTLDFLLYGLAVGDIDEDSTLEIMVNSTIISYNSQEYIIEYQNENILPHNNSITISDPDNDGDNEIVSRSAQILNVSNYDGQNLTIEWIFNDLGYGWRLDIGDLTGDGIPEVVAGKGIYLYHSFKVLTYTSSGWESIFESDSMGVLEVVIRVGDVDGIPGNEIVVSSVDSVTSNPSIEHSRFHIYKYINQSFEVIWESENQEARSTDFEIGDVDGDGLAEIVAGTRYGTVGSPDALIRIFGWNGQTFQLEWESELFPGYALNSMSAVEIGDVNGDSLLDIVSLDRDGIVRIFTWNGVYYDLIVDIDVDADLWQLAVGDIDRDGKSEVITGGYGIDIFAFENDTLIKEYSLSSGDYPRLGDVDSDGELELIVQDYGRYGHTAWYTAYDYYDSSFTEIWVGYELGYTRGSADMVAGDVDNDGWNEIIGQSWRGYFFIAQLDTTELSIKSDEKLSEGVVLYEYDLNQNCPNPFNPVTTIVFDIPELSDVKLTIYDLLGREMIELVNTHLHGGIHSVTWDGKDQHGRVLSSGMYFYRLDAVSKETGKEFHQTRKMVLLR